jgi:hypothetical protein
VGFKPGKHALAVLTAATSSPARRDWGGILKEPKGLMMPSQEECVVQITFGFPQFVLPGQEFSTDLGIGRSAGYATLDNYGYAHETVREVDS